MAPIELHGKGLVVVCIAGAGIAIVKVSTDDLSFIFYSNPNVDVNKHFLQLLDIMKNHPNVPLQALGIFQVHTNLLLTVPPFNKYNIISHHHHLSLPQQSHHCRSFDGFDIIPAANIVQTAATSRRHSPALSSPLLPRWVQASSTS